MSRYLLYLIGLVAGFTSIAMAQAPLPNMALQDNYKRAFTENQVYTVTWEGTFRRYDAEGKLYQDFPSRIDVTFDPSKELPYTQTNAYSFADGTSQVITSQGGYEDGKIVFSNPRIDGYSSAFTLEQDPSGRSSMLNLNFKDGSGLYMYEIITLSDDGNTRSRMSQYMIDGIVVRRTLIDELKTAEAWRAVE